jgi:hypothetical protein
MIRRATPAFALLVAAVLAAIASGDAALLLGLAPALVLLIPLTAGLFPGEGAIGAAARWLDSIRRHGPARSISTTLDFIPMTIPSGVAGLGFGTRGPPAAATI